MSLFGSLAHWIIGSLILCARLPRGFRRKRADPALNLGPISLWLPVRLLVLIIAFAIGLTMGGIGIEPMASAMSTRRSNQLSQPPVCEKYYTTKKGIGKYDAGCATPLRKCVAHPAYRVTPLTRRSPTIRQNQPACRANRSAHRSASRRHR